MYLTLFLLFLVGLCLGSFLNAWVHRLKNGKSILWGRSKCPLCDYTLQWFDLIPILSFFALQGKCRVCRQDISYQYPAVEFVTGILFVILYVFHVSGGGVDGWEALWLPLVRDMFVIIFLEAVFLFDFFYGEIPMRLTLAPASVLVVLSYVMSAVPFVSLVIGALGGAMFFWVQSFLSKGKWIGEGDIALGFFLGIILGWKYLLLALFLAYVGGMLVILPFLLFHRLHPKSKIPLGTFLSVATFFVMMWGDKILSFLHL